MTYLFSKDNISVYLALATTLIISQPLWAQNNAFIPPINHLLLDGSAEETRLEKTLQAYANPNSTHIFIAAHRGGRENDVQDQAPGNSIANIENATNNSFDLYESDIEILGDDTLIVFHDDTFNNLTNCNALPTCANPENLDDKDIDFAKSLRLTYLNGSVSNETIPTLEEFLTAAKGKIMVKFDLKSGTFSTNVLIRILNLVVETETSEQVLIRGGSNLLSVAADNGFDTNIIMRRFNTAPTLMEIEALINDYSVRAISIPNGASSDVLEAANAAGLVVEIHESQANGELEDSWETSINAGYRQFHSFKPLQLKEYLETNALREF